MNKNLQKNDFHDFITDENFKSWVVNPSKESDYYWQSWLSNHPEKADLVAAAKEFILSLKFEEQRPAQQLKNEIYQRVIELSKTAKEPTKHKRLILPYITLVRIAAVLAIAIGLSWLVVDFPFSIGSETEIIQYETKVTRAGEKLTVMLPDGSVVKLNSESSLRYPKTFGKSRQVYLTGEGFFEVEEDPSRPFTVQTKTLSTTALGTSFNVNAYLPEEEEVFLVTGKVRIEFSEGADGTQTLLPGEKVQLRNGKMNKLLDSPLSEIKWKDGVLIFRSTPFDSGVDQLERWFGVNISVQNLPGVSPAITGYFDNQSLSNILNTLGYSLGFEYEIIDKKVLIKFNK